MIVLVPRLIVSLFAIMLVAILVAWFGRAGLENGLLERIDGWVSVPEIAGWIARIFDWVAATASTTGMIIATVLMVGVLVYRRRVADALLLLAAAVSAAVAQGVIMEWVERPRPEGYALADTASFPSGQTFIAIAVYGLFALLLARTFPSTRARFLTYLISLVYLVVVAFGRLAVGAHFVSDVLAGIILGVVWLIAAFRLRSPSPRRGLRYGTRSVGW